MSVLEVKNVSIRYMTGDFKGIGLKEYILRKINHDYQTTEFWANKNISFTLEQGDMLGIIGTNGAGKSTLLKCISGIMEPTKGSVKRVGNIAALLELASGFDGDLTVKENTYLRGAMLGYTRRFMDETYDKIIDFAELREFENRPFKQLSSGMKSRLAFSIASLVQPDILILDEVLAVGDGAFRRKSEAKMKEIIECGATTIFVSHSLEQVRSMCNKILWLDKGCQVEFSSDVQGVCDRYWRFLNGSTGGGEDAPDIALTTDVYGRPKVTWSEISGADQYEVFRAAERDGAYRKMYTTSGTAYINTNTVPGETYFYKVRGMSGETAGSFSEEKSVTCPRRSMTVNVSLSADGKPALLWNAVSGAEKYEVYRAESRNGPFRRMYTTASTSYINKNSIPGTTYFYLVKAVSAGGIIKNQSAKAVSITAQA